MFVRSCRSMFFNILYWKTYSILWECENICTTVRVQMSLWWRLELGPLKAGNSDSPPAEFLVTQLMESILHYSDHRGNNKCQKQNRSHKMEATHPKPPGKSLIDIFNLSFIHWGLGNQKVSAQNIVSLTYCHGFLLFIMQLAAVPHLSHIFCSYEFGLHINAFETWTLEHGQMRDPLNFRADWDYFNKFRNCECSFGRGCSLVLLLSPEPL